MIPLVDRLGAAQKVLVLGCGGGFDVYVGIPLAVAAKARGCRVTYANLSFSNLADSGGSRFGEVAWRVEISAHELPYFPEKWLVEWLARNEWDDPVYGLSRTGVVPLRETLAKLAAEYEIDLILLVDGGTDSLIFGDEPGLGTIVEDAVSVVAASGVAGPDVILLSIGFGIDHFHGVSHHSFLENVAQVSRQGGFLGSFSLVRGTPEADAFIDLVDYANQRQPLHRSIVCNSIASALRGEFGDFHSTDRTTDGELFINPLMTQYWAFQALTVASCMKYARALESTRSIDEAASVIEAQRQSLTIRPRKPLPL